VLKVQQFFDEQKAAALEASQDAAARAEMSRGG
jgi:GTP-binding protein